MIGVMVAKSRPVLGVAVSAVFEVISAFCFIEIIEGIAA
jgi:hypothetical protein